MLRRLGFEWRKNCMFAFCLIYETYTNTTRAIQHTHTTLYKVYKRKITMNTMNAVKTCVIFRYCRCMPSLRYDGNYPNEKLAVTLVSLLLVANTNTYTFLLYTQKVWILFSLLSTGCFVCISLCVTIFFVKCFNEKVKDADANFGYECIVFHR